MNAAAAYIEATSDELPQSEEIIRVAAAITGDEAAFMSLVHSWSPLLLRLASWIGNDASAEQLVRGTWVRAVAQLSDFRPPPRLRVWLCRVLLEEARATRVISNDPAGHRQAQPRATVDPHRFRPAEDKWPGNWASPPRPCPASGASARSLLDFDTDKAVSRLLEAERVVLSLRDGAGCDIAAITGLLAITAGQARSLLNAGRAGVRDALDEHLLGVASS